jgi:cell shape-determining protein MreC
MEMSKQFYQYEYKIHRRRIEELEKENMRLRQALAANVSKSVYKRLQVQLSATKSVE